MTAACESRVTGVPGDAPSSRLTGSSASLTTDAEVPAVPVGLTQLSASQVHGLPSGDARGDDAEGTYLAADDAPVSFRCFCRIGSCDDERQQRNVPRGVVSVAQSDGRLSIDLTQGGFESSCTGGLDADGAFWCGKAASDTAELREFFRLSGQLSSASDGARALELELMVTRREASATRVSDCDTWSALTVREQL
jgi:hypothetical protein